MTVVTNAGCHQLLDKLTTLTTNSSSNLGDKSAPDPSYANGPTNGAANNTVIPHTTAHSSNAGAIAGSVVGGLVAGLLVGALIAFLLLRHRFHRQLESLHQGWYADKTNQDQEVVQPATLMYTDPSQSKQLQDAKARIKALERERNAASAFGDTLDARSEQELLSAPAFGLDVYNEIVNQVAMSLAVNSSGRGTPGCGSLPRGLGECIELLRARGSHTARDNFEASACPK